MNQFKYTLQDKAAIVTGGGTGIGRAVSTLLARQGVSVAIFYSRSDGDARDTVSTITGEGGKAIAFQADIADASTVRATIAMAHQSFGRIDYLVNNAGITRQLNFNDLDAIDDGVWDELLDVNVKGTFHCCQAAAPYLRKHPGSAIVNIGSIAGETGYGSSLPYAVSKSAVHGMTRSLARALAPSVRVNCVAPGAVATRWWHGNEEKMHALSGHLPLQRVSTPEDIADLVLMLLRAEFDLYESVGGTQAGIFVIHHDDRRGGRRSCRKLCPLIFAAVFWLLFREARATVLLRRDLV